MLFFYGYPVLLCFFFFFFNDTATTEIYTLSLHDALPIWLLFDAEAVAESRAPARQHRDPEAGRLRSEEHTSELQSRPHLVCRLLLEKKKKNNERSNVSPITTSSTDAKLRHLRSLPLWART